LTGTVSIPWNRFFAKVHTASSPVTSPTGTPCVPATIALTSASEIDEPPTRTSVNAVPEYVCARTARAAPGLGVIADEENDLELAADAFHRAVGPWTPADQERALVEFVLYEVCHRCVAVAHDNLVGTAVESTFDRGVRLLRHELPCR
jgi:hypothetical protein